MEISPIGYITSDLHTHSDAPFQGRMETNKGTLELLPEYVDGLQNLSAGREITIIFNFHLSTGYKLITKTPHHDEPRGIFATRSPNRPNSLGLTTVKIISISDNLIHFEGADMLDGTPVIDIKPALKNQE